MFLFIFFLNVLSFFAIGRKTYLVKEHRITNLELLKTN